jgi:transketolase
MMKTAIAYPVSNMKGEEWNHESSYGKETKKKNENIGFDEFPFTTRITILVQ